ncbi:MAG: hypothetical protein P4M09_06310 [Devosia sp.]|nr:hypothetical protein [Devosia sp.]
MHFRPVELKAAAWCLAAVALCLLPGPSQAARVRPSPRLPAARTVAAAAAPLAAPSDAAALGGYNVLIADRGNNRLLLVSPEKRILWAYDFVGLRPGAGADDAFFTPDGKSIIVNLEHEQVIQIIDRATKTVTWQYGTLGKRGSAPGLLDYPDDAYLLPNGDVIVADIRNCRILEIAPDKHIVRQAGVTGRCFGAAPALASPNGDKPLPNGHVLVSTIGDRSLTELDATWQPILKLPLPIRYPSDPQMTAAGNYLVAAYTNPGRIIEIGRDGRLVWDYSADGEGLLDRPSLAIELPNGNILANDDLNHRVIVIDKALRKIVWQYGVTRQPGAEAGHLSIPDGLDIEPIRVATDFTSKRRME